MLKLALGNLWIILAIVLAIGGAFTGTYLKGRAGGIADERARQEVKWAAQERASVKIAAEAKDKARTIERDMQNRYDILEGTYHAQKADLDKVRGDNARIAASRSLYDRGATCTPAGGNRLPGAADAAGGAAGTAAGCQLSFEASQFLLELAGEADAAAILAQLGHGLAEAIRPPAP